MMKFSKILFSAAIASVPLASAHTTFIQYSGANNCETTTFYACTYHDVDMLPEDGGFYIKEDGGTELTFYDFDSDTAIPIANVPAIDVDGGRIMVPGPAGDTGITRSCRQATALLDTGIYRISTSSTTVVDTPYSDLFAAGVFAVTDASTLVPSSYVDTEDPIKILCEANIVGLDEFGCYLTDFTREPVFQDCSHLTFSQTAGRVTEQFEVVTVTATDASGNFAECEMTITGDDRQCDSCPDDPFKTAPGICGCGTSDFDNDRDGTPDCFDLCIEDRFKTTPGLCGCGVPETDRDGDGVPDCNDFCPDDPEFYLLEDCSQPPDDEAVCNYAILAETAIAHTATSTANITGDVGLSVAGSAAITGLFLVPDVGGQFATSPFVSGKVIAEDYGEPITIELRAAIAAGRELYAAIRAKTSTEVLVAGELGGRTFGPGVYSIGAAMTMTTDVTLTGTSDDVFIFSATGAITTAAAAKVILVGGVQPKNIFWTASGAVTIAAAAEMQGIFLTATAATMGAKATLVGAIYAQTAVTLDGNTIESAGSCNVPPTPAPVPTPTIPLGSSCGYSILAKSGIATVPTSIITGNIGVSPITAAAMTGFALTLDGGGQFSTSSQVNGECHGASYGGIIALRLTVAVLDMEAAYTAAANSFTPILDRKELAGGIIGGLTLTPGVYTFTTAVPIYEDLYLDGQGNPNAVFIIQTTGVLTLAANTNVVLLNGAKARNVFWQVAGNIATGAGSVMQGNLLCKTNVAIGTGGTVIGRIHAQTEVALGMATVTGLPCVEEVTDILL